MASSSNRRRAAVFNTFCVKKEKNAILRQVSAALQKAEADRTEDEKVLLKLNDDVVEQVSERQKKRQEVKARSEEFEDPEDVLLTKCKELATVLRSSKHLVVYTGAGISTAAKIPDYRGTNGIWTLLQKGKDIGSHDLSQAEPTLTHMALYQLYVKGILKYVVSQNCDGLHLRSGLPRCAISEVHGNMHIEVCRECRPCLQYWRLFDVTENTGRFSHRTMRRCHVCHSALLDTIVHFGERGSHPWPLNWPSAGKAADNADVILCIGSSLKVLKKYPWLWGMDKPAKKRPKLYIINLQWTPKDDHAVLKINGRCDRVMLEVMKNLDLEIPNYDRLQDPIFRHATLLHPGEEHTTNQPELDSPIQENKDGGPPFKKVKLEDSSLSYSVLNIETNFDLEVSVKVEGKKAVSKETDIKIEPCNKIEESCITVPEIKVEKEEVVICTADSSADFAGVCNFSSLSNVVVKSEEDLIYQDVESYSGASVLVGSWEENHVSIIENVENKTDFSVNKTTRTGEKNRREDVDFPMCEGKENRDEAISEGGKSLTKTFREKSNSRNAGGSTEKENCLEESSKNDDSCDSNSKSNGSSQNGVQNLQNVEGGVLRILQIEHNYSKAGYVRSEVGKPEDDNSDLPPTRTSSRVREKRTMAAAAASAPKRVEPIPSKPAAKPQNKDKDKINKADYEIKPIKCSFCEENYLSPLCLFYPSFNSRPRQFEGCICECCDYSDSEEEVEDEEDEESKESRSSDTGEEQPSKTQVINPGWYGKGCRKRRRK